jgi:hypothetical protein
MDCVGTLGAALIHNRGGDVDADWASFLDESGIRAAYGLCIDNGRKAFTAMHAAGE